MVAPALAPPQTPWHQDLLAIAEAILEGPDGPADPRRLRWLVDDVDHFLMTVGGRSRLAIRGAILAVSRLGPLAIASPRAFKRLPVTERQRALTLLERSPAGLAVFAVKTLLSFHWFEHPDTVREHGLERRARAPEVM